MSKRKEKPVSKVEYIAYESMCARFERMLIRMGILCAVDTLAMLVSVILLKKR
jgi:hypothetical protein